MRVWWIVALVVAVLVRDSECTYAERCFESNGDSLCITEAPTIQGVCPPSSADDERVMVREIDVRLNGTIAVAAWHAPLGTAEFELIDVEVAPTDVPALSHLRVRAPYRLPRSLVVRFGFSVAPPPPASPRWSAGSSVVAESNLTFLEYVLHVGPVLSIVADLEPPGGWAAVEEAEREVPSSWGFGGGVVGGAWMPCRASEVDEYLRQGRRSRIERGLGTVLRQLGESLALQLTGADERCGPIGHSDAFLADERGRGADWPSCGQTMVGVKRLSSLQSILQAVALDGVEGDVVETGVWKGGAMMFARTVLNAIGPSLDGGRRRRVWLFDSFAGLPLIRSRHEDTDYSRANALLQVGLEAVESGFEARSLLAPRVGLDGVTPSRRAVRHVTPLPPVGSTNVVVDRGDVLFVRGFFNETVPLLAAHPFSNHSAPLRDIAVLRLDGDLYASTMETLLHFAPLVRPGGFIVIDDWSLPATQRAVTDFRVHLDVPDPLVLDDDFLSAFWRVSAPIHVDLHAPWIAGLHLYEELPSKRLVLV